MNAPSVLRVYWVILPLPLLLLLLPLTGVVGEPNLVRKSSYSLSESESSAVAMPIVKLLGATVIRLTSVEGSYRNLGNCPSEAAKQGG